ncbi:DUF1120 domain-containing protein [Enterobacter sp. ECC-219]|uniref:DUF1120 domain-containing protein n=1 Tax=Enterobacter sp. ECC-219 TaxID=3116480 RepID=UPI003754311F
MKKILLASAVAMALTAAGANAASTAVLKVTGLLAVEACTPTLSGGGVVDYGRIHLSELSATTDNQLGTKDISLTINCPDAGAKAGWTITDDSAASRATGVTITNGDAANGSVSSADQSYGVGLAGDVKIGAYSVYTDVANVLADGVRVDPIFGAATTPTWAKSTTGIIKNGNAEMMTVAATGTTAPLAYSTAVFPLKVSLAIEDTTTLAITDDTNLSGQATITVKYI